jgi:CopG family nickel-responsive transcriptional regulator
MEVAVSRGEMHHIRDFAVHVISERGVRHGRLVTVPVELDTQTHAHGGEASRHHLHTHVREVG